MSDVERGLLRFVSPNFSHVSALVIDAAEILPDLRKILPAAQIALLTTAISPAIKKICNEIRADLFVGDVLSLPPAPKVFELIIAPEILTGGEFYVPLLTLNHLLRDSGALLTRFDGALWSKRDVVKILSDAVYNEIHFAPSDVSEEIWLVKACKCTAEVVALKEIFTPEIRAELSRILHRIEYGIDVAGNLRRLTELRDRAGIFDEYLTDFIGQVVVHASARKFLLEHLELPEIVDDD